MKKLIVLTDLDGTLLDSSYSFAAAAPALDALKERKIPLVICSSKTRKEIEVYRTRLGNTDPFIAENGGGIYIPNSLELDVGEDDGSYRIVSLGTRYQDLRRGLVELRKEGFDIIGFGDLGIPKIMEITGLSEEEAALAKEREYDEPFLLPEETLEPLLEAIRRKGFSVIGGGRMMHLTRGNDKGKAVRRLLEIYGTVWRDMVTVGLGDGPNDAPMLESVDIPVAVATGAGRCHPLLDRPWFLKTKAVGPAGWNEAMLRILDSI